MKVTVVYTMQGCPFCGMIKEELDKENILYIERDIFEFQDEIVTNNELCVWKRLDLSPEFVLV